MSDEVEFSAFTGCAQAQQMVAAVVGLALAGAFHAYLQDTSVGGFDGTAANEQAGGPIRAVAHAVVVGVQ
ncbi:hypothetical protein [Hymenobacter nivis]|uniref:Uncharacterized protein n=1 Tax=Hymenobacter nivis TaxID=1850093 RepID=A0A2Z3GE98_9BACT|nr:hypothetical protein [Hymenobacter nivis]AWM31989.1 hypothetical protein DDQ68_03780 [Hymenobacter nivis]